LPSIYLYDDAPRCYNCKGFGHYARCCPNWISEEKVFYIGPPPFNHPSSISLIEGKSKIQEQSELLNQSTMLQWYESHYIDPLTGRFIPCSMPYDVAMFMEGEEEPRIFKNKTENVIRIDDTNKFEECDSEDIPEHETVISVN